MLNQLVQAGLCALPLLFPAPLPAQDSAPTDARQAEWLAARGTLPAEQRAGLDFLLAHMPAQDMRDLPVALVIENIALAYEARDRVPWGASLPEELFLNDVLPYAQVNETREPWRRALLERCMPMIAGCATPAEAAQRLNEKLFGAVGVRYSTKRKKPDQSPAESMEIGMASCTGLSILLADACRAVAIPARLAGIYSWVNKRGNHTWVEVWDADGWHFTGAAEADGRGLDHGWFQGDAALAQRGSRDHAIWAASYQPTGQAFPMVWAPRADWVHGVDVTPRYVSAAPAKEGVTRLMVRVVTQAGGPRVAVPVSVRVVGAKNARANSWFGNSRNESFDTNDLLTFDVPSGANYEVKIVNGAEELRVERLCEGPQEVVTFVLPAAQQDAANEIDLAESLTVYFEAEAAERADMTFSAAQEQLLRRDPARVRAMAWEAYRNSPLHTERRADFSAHRVRKGGHESPYTLKEVGSKPAGGWPLFIAMHGGGGVPKNVNDSQWRHMQIYYKDHPELGGYLYLALRAPNDSWNGFYTGYIYPLIGELVQQMLLCEDVDPDRVHVMGYSHGGYGAFAIGPQLCHLFASVHASAAAPTGGETTAVSLRNTHFTFMIGERDTAYGRIDRCREFDKLLEGLRAGRTDIYPGGMQYCAGFGHGGLPDRDKITEMYAITRHARPRELSWQISGSHVREHFWLEVDEPASGVRIDALRDGNRITLKGSGLKGGGLTLSLALDERSIDFDQPLLLSAGEREATLQIHPHLRTLCESLLRRGDPRMAYSARIQVQLE